MKRSILSIFFFSFAVCAAELTVVPEKPARPMAFSVLHSPVCFSPDEGCDRELSVFLANAQKSLDVAIYDLNEPAIVNALIERFKKIPVRVVCDAGESKGPHSFIAQLVAAGIPVRYGHQRGIMHDKFTVLDSEIVETGSFNYTTRAAKSNQENQIYLSDPILVARYQSRFEKMWADGKPIEKPVSKATEKTQGVKK